MKSEHDFSLSMIFVLTYFKQLQNMCIAYKNKYVYVDVVADMATPSSTSS